jgi:hypothetical protein
MSSLTAPDRILQAMFMLSETQGVDEPTKKLVATMANIKMGSMPAILSRELKKNGLIVYGSGKDTIKLTSKGRDRAATLAPCEDMVTSNQEVRSGIKQRLKGMARSVFEYLEDGKEREKSEVMEAMNCTKKNSFYPIVSRDLKKFNYVIYPSKNTIQLNPAVCSPFENGT